MGSSSVASVAKFAYCCTRKTNPCQQITSSAAAVGGAVSRTAAAFGSVRAARALCTRACMYCVDGCNYWGKLLGGLRSANKIALTWPSVESFSHARHFGRHLWSAAATHLNPIPSRERSDNPHRPPSFSYFTTEKSDPTVAVTRKKCYQAARESSEKRPALTQSRPALLEAGLISAIINLRLYGVVGQVHRTKIAVLFNGVDVADRE
eukprot:IDg7611t1